MASLKLLPVGGVTIGTGPGGIKYADRDDVAVINFGHPVPTAALFTQNQYAAAPVIVAKRNLGPTSTAWLINSGNANCGTGDPGLQVATNSTRDLAKLLKSRTRFILPFSTGVIMEPLEPGKLRYGYHRALDNLDANNWAAAARAIMTTDTVPKGVSVRVGNITNPVTVTGIAKGSGMINPNMATMLAFITTDADVTSEWLQDCLQTAVVSSFNAISVDGDTSTNDAVALAATGTAGKLVGRQLTDLHKAIVKVCQQLAYAIVKDGEGATTVATVSVAGLATDQDCAQVAGTIANSPLIKTMLYARDPNLGRLLMALGNAQVKLDINRVKIYLKHKLVFAHGQRHASFSETEAAKLMREEPVVIKIVAGTKKTAAHKVFCDLGPDYIKINAEYRS